MRQASEGSGEIRSARAGRAREEGETERVPIAFSRALNCAFLGVSDTIVGTLLCCGVGIFYYIVRSFVLRHLMIALVRNTKKITLFLSDACRLGSELTIHTMYLAIRMSAMRAGWGAPGRRNTETRSYRVLAPPNFPCHDYSLSRRLELTLRTSNENASRMPESYQQLR